MKREGGREEGKAVDVGIEIDMVRERNEELGNPCER